VIGLGAMGLGVARSLLRAGFKVHACDVRSQVLEAFAAEGGIACATPAELGSQCEVVVTVVVNAAQTETVLFGSETQPGAVSTMKPETLRTLTANRALMDAFGSNGTPAIVWKDSHGVVQAKSGMPPLSELSAMTGLPEQPETDRDLDRFR